MKGTNHISRVASDFYFITMEIIIDNKKIIVESAKWRIEHEKYYSISGRFYGIEFDLDYVYITIHKNFIKDLLYLLIERSEHKIEFDGKVANFYITTDNLNKLFSELKNEEVQKLNIEFVGTCNEVGE